MSDKGKTEMANRSPARRSPCVLIVDDNVGLAENIAEILEMEGYVAVIAATGNEAIEKVAPASPDIVLTDYRLPDTNGAQLVQQLQAMGLRARTIVMSAYTDEGTVREATSIGARFLAKPLDFTRLGDLIADREGNA